MGGVSRPSRTRRRHLSAPASIQASHDTSKFSCGHESLDRWLKAAALKSEGRSARSYVVCDRREVAGYYCLATGSVARTAAPKRIARNTPDPIPVVIIGRLAVGEQFQGRGIGAGLLRDAFARILQLSGSVGVRAVLVHAIDDSAAEFYRQYGFIEFPGGSRALFLPLETLRKAL